MAKTKLNLKTLSLLEKIELARRIAAAMTDNPAFVPPAPSPTPTLERIADSATAAESAYNEAVTIRETAQQKTALQNAREADLDTQLALLAAYVESATGGDAEKILSAGIAIRSQRSPSSVPPRVANLAAAAGEKEGTIDLTWDAPPPAARVSSFTIELAPTDGGGAGGAGGWSYAKTVVKSRATIAGLTSGQRVWFRVAAVGAAGQGPWSDPATKIVP